MKFFIKFILPFFITTLLHSSTYIINNNSKENLLKYSELYIDKSSDLEIENILQDNKIVFNPIKKEFLSYGYSPNFAVWIKFKLHNNSSKKVEKILEYANSLTTNVIFYSPDNNYEKTQKGLFHLNNSKRTINPIFEINLNPNETKTYYLRASSNITTLIIKLNLWDTEEFYYNESEHKLILGLFFGSMFILAIYNLFIYFFTKDKSYLYYVVYILGLLVHHFLYVGLSNLYFSQEMIKYCMEYASLIIALPVIALALFTKKFLSIKQYKNLNRILNFLLIIIPLSVVIFITTDGYDHHRNTLTLALLFYLSFLAIYATFKKNRQAYFILFGWCIIFVSVLLMVLSGNGWFNIFTYYSYTIETAFALEAVVFSIALADRINRLIRAKEESSLKLIEQQESENKRLEENVTIKTNDLKNSLDEKELLLKELNHRVKNNMQMIISLVRLQGDKSSSQELHNVFLTIQNRIKAMSQLHELLYKQDSIATIDTYTYFDLLINELKDSYDSENILIHLNIKENLKIDEALYCGLILNELITNSFKYAFPNLEGNIKIDLIKVDEEYKFTIYDDGIGYEKKDNYTSLGLLLINTLVENQLNGYIECSIDNGVYVKIGWMQNEEKENINS